MATRTVASVTIQVDRDSLADVPVSTYLSRLEAAVRAMPDVTEDTEVNVFAGDRTRYEGLYSDSEPWQYDAMTDRLHALAADVFESCCTDPDTDE